jgi:hypothetical protein
MDSLPPFEVHSSIIERKKEKQNIFFFNGKCVFGIIQLMARLHPPKYNKHDPKLCLVSSVDLIKVLGIFSFFYKKRKY